ncbi:phosphopantothenoylcysteine decarboxylase [Brevibacillus thermoruber]|uniref:phosphopantothenoylcysteine decarboxylase domain-containing protein n=1 Tax=Brevibacillus thermoruber TaxID=33942 RepID=UPI000426611E|nr:phosphopantothenoylcysteine decarboxylase [Brevibacillus thermoruber]
MQNPSWRFFMGKQTGMKSAGIVVGPGKDGVNALKLADQLSSIGTNVYVSMTETAARYFNESVFTEVAKCHGVLTPENNVVADVDIVVDTGALFEKDGWDKESIRARERLCKRKQNPVIWIQDGAMQSIWKLDMVTHHEEIWLLKGAARKERSLSYEEIVMEAMRTLLGKRNGDFTGIKVIVTGGGTIEPIDPVRHITNRSSGKMGKSLAEVFRDRVADVVFICTNRTLGSPIGTEFIHVDDVESLRREVLRQSDSAEILVMAAAVSDYRCKERSTTKIKKTSQPLHLELVPIPNFMKEVPKGVFKVGFAAETDPNLEGAKRKLLDRGFDLLCLNDVSRSDAGFEVDTNQVMIVGPEGTRHTTRLENKYLVAWQIVDEIQKCLRESANV